MSLDQEEEERRLLEKICREPGCCNESAKGYVVCVACLYGVAVRAAPELIALKKKVARRKKKAADESACLGGKCVHCGR